MERTVNKTQAEMRKREIQKKLVGEMKNSVAGLSRIAVAEVRISELQDETTEKMEKSCKINQWMAKKTLG